MTEESTLALKTGPLLFPGIAHRPHDGWRLWPRGRPLGRTDRTPHRSSNGSRGTCQASARVIRACRRDTVDPNQKTMMVQSGWRRSSGLHQGWHHRRELASDHRRRANRRPCAGIDQTRQIAPHLRCSPHGNVSYLIGAFSRAASLSTSSGGRSEVIQNCGGTGSRW